MADIIIKALIPILADITEVAVFVTFVGLVTNLAKGALTKGEIRF